MNFYRFTVMKPEPILPTRSAPGVMRGRHVESPDIFEVCTVKALENVVQAVKFAHVSNTTSERATAFNARDNARDHLEKAAYNLDIGNNGFPELRARASTLARQIRREEDIDLGVLTDFMMNLKLVAEREFKCILERKGLLVLE